MDVDDAMEQISDIHQHLSRSEIFRGYAALTVLGIGIAAFALAGFQSLIRPPASDAALVIQWSILGGIIAASLALRIAYTTLKKGTLADKHLAAIVFAQFTPSLIAGLLVTIIFLYYNFEFLALLPGIWAILFSMGIFSMRPYLPRHVGHVAFYFLVAGCVLLYLSLSALSLNPWAMGVTFGLGHILSSVVLQMDVARYRK